MTVLAVLAQAVSLALMRRMWKRAIYPTPAEDGESNREGTEASDF